MSFHISGFCRYIWAKRIFEEIMLSSENKYATYVCGNALHAFMLNIKKYCFVWILNRLVVEQFLKAMVSGTIFYLPRIVGFTNYKAFSKCHTISSWYW